MSRRIFLFSAVISLFLSTQSPASEMVFIPGGEYDMGDHHGDGYSIILPKNWAHN